MGLFDLFRSPEKQIEKEGKLLKKPDRTVAVITAYRDWEQSESITTEDGDTDIRSFYMEEADLRFQIDGEWYEYTTNPREGKADFIVGDQWIVKYSKGSKAIVALQQKLREDSPYRIKE